MKGYLRDRQAQEKVSRWTGVGLTVAVHVIVVLCFVFSGFRYVWPPPQERILISFEDIDDLELEEVPPEMRGQTAADIVDPEKEIEEVRKAESPLHSNTKNNATASTPTPSGDVEIPATQETALDPKAIFPGHSKRDTTHTSQGSSSPTGNLTPGQVNGGPDGTLDGSANAKVEGRSVTKKGTLRPTVNKKGLVVIDIYVNPQGKVIEAYFNASKSDTSDKELIDKAIEAAYGFVFSVKSDDVKRRQGTVTCKFNLK